MSTDTPRKCQAHFGMGDMLCQHQCGATCVVANPSKVNLDLASVTEERDRLKLALDATYELNREHIAYLEQQLAASEEAVIKKCAEACKAERLHDPQPNTCDEAYDRGVNDCFEAIRALSASAAPDRT